MKKLLLVLFFIGPTIYSQGESKDKIFFSEALFTHLPDYNKKADKAYQFHEYEKGKELFDSLTNYCLEGSYMDNFKFNNLKKREVHLYDYKKPIFLITYASWVVPSKGEIPALNQLAKKFEDRIDFVVLFWDKRETVKKLAEQFKSPVTVVYVDETKNEGAYVVKQLKHSLGLPTCFLISGDKKIMDIRRSVFPPMQTEEETAYRENYQAMEASIDNNLINSYEGVYAENVILVD